MIKWLRVKYHDKYLLNTSWTPYVASHISWGQRGLWREILSSQGQRSGVGLNKIWRCLAHQKWGRNNIIYIYICVCVCMYHIYIYMCVCSIYIYTMIIYTMMFIKKTQIVISTDGKCCWLKWSSKNCVFACKKMILPATVRKLTEKQRLFEAVFASISNV